MMTDKDRIDFLEDYMKESRRILITLDSEHVSLREQLDRDLAEMGYTDIPDFYCECGTGFCDLDCAGMDGNVVCIASTTPTPCGDPALGGESWTSTYECPTCGRTFDIEESN